MIESITADDVAWIKREVEHCRRMEYTEEAQRFERIHAALAASADTHPKGGDSTQIEAPASLSGAGGSEASETPNPSPSPAAGR